MLQHVKVNPYTLLHYTAHYITTLLPYITLCYITFITLHYTTLHGNTWNDITRHYMALLYIYITLPDGILPYLTYHITQKNVCVHIYIYIYTHIGIQYTCKTIETYQYTCRIIWCYMKYVHIQYEYLWFIIQIPHRSRHATVWKKPLPQTQTVRVQVPNNHILSKILTYITTILKPSTLLGPLDPWGKPRHKALRPESFGYP